MSDKKRVGLLDELRGFAIICMVVYHLMFDLKYLFGVDVPIFFESWFNVVRDWFAGLFICISGIACNYSSNNLKRGVQCFFIGAAFTIVTTLVTPSTPDMFGILHCLGICMMIYGLGENLLRKIPSIIGIIVSVFLFLATLSFPYGYIGIRGLFWIDLPDALYQYPTLYPFGFPNNDFVSSDYFPLLPWFFLFIAGSYFGVYVKNGLMPKFFYNTHIKLFTAAGRYSLWVYVFHQPIIYGILCLIFGKSLF